jgi:phosphatidate phosphatase
MDRQTKTRVIGFLNFVILIMVAVPIIVLRFSVDPAKRGFFCNDETLSHPIKESTVTNTALIIVGISLPIAIIILTEFFIPMSNIPQPKKETSTRILFLILDHLFGVGVTVLLTDIAKYTIGRLR